MDQMLFLVYPITLCKMLVFTIILTNSVKCLIVLVIRIGLLAGKVRRQTNFISWIFFTQRAFTFKHLLRQIMLNILLILRTRFGFIRKWTLEFIEFFDPGSYQDFQDYYERRFGKNPEFAANFSESALPWKGFEFLSTIGEIGLLVVI